MKASELAVELRKADYDTPYVWDLTAQAADLIESQAKAIEEMEQVGWLHTYSDDEGTWKWLYKEKPAVSGGSLVPVFTAPQALASYSKEGEQG